MQIPGVLDDLYAAKAAKRTLGATWKKGVPSLALWAPTAQKVDLLARHRPAGRGEAAVRRLLDGRRQEVLGRGAVPLGGHGLRADDRPGRGQPGHRPVLGGAHAELDALGARGPGRPRPSVRASGRRRSSRWCGPWTRRSTSCTCGTSRSMTLKVPAAKRGHLPGVRHQRQRPRAPARAGEGGPDHGPPAADVRHRLHPGGQGAAGDAGLRPRVVRAGLRPAAGLRHGGGRRGRLQLGLRPAALDDARGVVRGERRRRRPRRGVPHDGRRAARGRPAGGARPGVQPHHGQRPVAAVRAGPRGARLLPAARPRPAPSRRRPAARTSPRSTRWRRRPWSTRW